MSRLGFRRAALLSVAPLALVALFAGLARIGVPVGFAGARAGDHGPLFVLGVFFTLISLERAVAFGSLAGYSAPALGLLFGLGVVANVPELYPVSVLGAAALVLLNAALWRKQASAHVALMFVGSLSLLFGNLVWVMGAAVSDVVLSWIAFFVLTIVAERIELARFASPPRRAVQGILLLAFTMAGLALFRVDGDSWVVRTSGALLTLIGAWLMRYDLARRTIRQPGLPRYAAVAALGGAAWLCCSGLLLVARGLPPAGPLYDAALHGIFVGFVLSMVFGHAPIILPAVARVPLPFHAVLYAPLLALHLGLIAREAGDLLGLPLLRQAGGLTNALALLAFVGAGVWARRRGLSSQHTNHVLGAE